jgi:hypothetical protein
MIYFSPYLTSFLVIFIDFYVEFTCGTCVDSSHTDNSTQKCFLHDLCVKCLVIPLCISEEH